MICNLSKNTHKKHIKAFIIMIIILFIIFGSIFGFSYFINIQKQKMLLSWKMQPVEVTATIAKKGQWSPNIVLTGDAIASQNVNITTKASGIINSILFESGQKIKKGQLLFTLDTSELNAKLNQAIAKLSLSKITYQRNQNLLQKNMISYQEVDESKSIYQQDFANVAAIKANIDDHFIRAPFDGTIGLKKINVGQYFNAGSNAACLNNISSIYINFSVPQNLINKINIGGNIEFTADTYPGMIF